MEDRLKHKKLSALEWRAVLMGTHPGLYQQRRLLSMLPSDPRCRLCNAPFHGIGGKLMSWMGRSQYRNNPLFCQACLVEPVEGVEVEITMLFADVRGSTTLAEKMSASEFASLMNRFYEVASHILIHSYAIIDKYVGDGVIGLYIPGLAGADHARKAIQAAEAILQATGHVKGNPWLPVGVGVHTGAAYISMVGSKGGVGDFTALGDSMNITSRLASQAGTGEVLVSESAYNKSELVDFSEQRLLELKGRHEPVSVHVMKI
jgi:adenylate cyclase